MPPEPAQVYSTYHRDGNWVWITCRARNSHGVLGNCWVVAGSALRWLTDNTNNARAQSFSVAPPSWRGSVRVGDDTPGMAPSILTTQFQATARLECAPRYRPRIDPDYDVLSEEIKP